MRFGVPAAAEDLLEELLQLFFQGVSAPLVFFPESALAYARARLVRGKSHAIACAAAERVWVRQRFFSRRVSRPLSGAGFSGMYGRLRSISSNSRKPF